MKTKKNNNSSFIFSILDTFKCPDIQPFVFEDIGSGTLGSRHILSFFRHPRNEILLIEKSSRVVLNSSLSFFEIHSEAQKITFGYFFLVRDSSELRLTDKTLFYGNADNVGDFALVPCINDKNGIFVYKDAQNNFLLNISASAESPFVVLDP
jgi:hypothetical protein